MLHALIMAGGSGTRFWPASRNASPKQMLALTGHRTMIQATCDRVRELVPPERVLVITNQRLTSAIRSQLPDLPPQAILGEPCKRDTAPCIGLAAGLMLRGDPDAVMVVMPSDHVIAPTDEFHRAIRQAVEYVGKHPGSFVTFGIRPSYPAESFGYIERGERCEAPRGECPMYDVVRFHEKPRGEVARAYVESGNFYWNSGIFVWGAAAIRDALAEHEPEMHERLCRIAQSFETSHFQEVLAREFSEIVGRSIDYAVMEKARHVNVIEAPFGWDDVGSWQAMARLLPADDAQNTFIGKHLAIDTEGCIVRSDDSHLVVTIGLRDCVVVHTPDATLVVPKDQEERVREAVKKLESLGQHEYL